MGCGGVGGGDVGRGMGRWEGSGVWGDGRGVGSGRGMIEAWDGIWWGEVKQGDEDCSVETDNSCLPPNISTPIPIHIPPHPTTSHHIPPHYDPPFPVPSHLTPPFPSASPSFPIPSHPSRSHTSQPHLHSHIFTATSSQPYLHSNPHPLPLHQTQVAAPAPPQRI